MRQKGLEPDPAKIPLDPDDLDYDNQIALAIYNRLGNRVSSNSGFIGKDYTNLNIFMEIFGVLDKLFLLDLLICIEIYYISENQKTINKMIEDSKKKK